MGSCNDAPQGLFFILENNPCGFLELLLIFARVSSEEEAPARTGRPVICLVEERLSSVFTEVHHQRECVPHVSVSPTVSHSSLFIQMSALY